MAETGGHISAGSKTTAEQANGFQTNPANGYTDNATFAGDTDSGTTTNTSCTNSGKDRHIFYTYNFSSIPSGSTIAGIEVQLDMKVDSTNGAPKSCIELSWDGGTTWTTPKISSSFTTAEASYPLGSASDTWGHTWSTGELSNLRVRITNVASSTSRDFSLDWIPVRVSYLPLAEGTATFTPTPTYTSTPTATQPTNTATATPTFTNTPTHTPTATLPPTVTPSPSPVPVFSNATFTYDGDGRRVKSEIVMDLGTTTTYFVSNFYEVSSDGTVTKHYFAGAQRVAMRQYKIPQPSTLTYFLTDHLGSTNVMVNKDGVSVSELRYRAWGEVRYPVNGQNPGPSDYTYTGQYSNMDDFGLMFYNARFYSPYLNRFVSADTIVPGYANPQNLNRYSYVTNNPLRYTDPTGHMQVQDGPQQDRFKQSVADKYVPKPKKKDKDDGGGGHPHAAPKLDSGIDTRDFTLNTLELTSIAAKYDNLSGAAWKLAAVSAVGAFFVPAVGLPVGLFFTNEAVEYGSLSASMSDAATSSVQEGGTTTITYREAGQGNSTPDIVYTDSNGVVMKNEIWSITSLLTNNIFSDLENGELNTNSNYLHQLP